MKLLLFARNFFARLNRCNGWINTLRATLTIVNFVVFAPLLVVHCSVHNLPVFPFCCVVVIALAAIRCMPPSPSPHQSRMPGLEDVLGILLCLDNCKYIFRTAFDVNPITQSPRYDTRSFACLVFVNKKSNEGLSALLQIAVLKASCHHEVEFFVDQTIVGRRGPRSMCHHIRSSQRITLTAGGDEQQQCPVLGCCDFDCCGPGTSWDTTSEVCILDFSSESFNGSFPSYYKKGCLHRTCLL